MGKQSVRESNKRRISELTKKQLVAELLECRERLDRSSRPPSGAEESMESSLAYHEDNEVYL